MITYDTFFSRLSLAMILGFTVVGIALTALVNQSTQNYQDEVKQRLHLDLAKQVIKFNPLFNQGEIDQEALKQAFHTMMVLGPGFEFYLLDQQGKILSYSAEDNKIVRESVSMTPIQQFTKGAKLLPIVGDDPRSYERKKIFSVAPVYDEKKLVQAYLYVIIGGEIYDDVVELFSQNHLFNVSLWTISAILLFSLMAVLLVFFWLTRPIAQLNSDMKGFIDNEFKIEPALLQRWQTRSNNEIYRLGQSFVAMAQYIAEQFSIIKKNEKQRSLLLSHISHDLRTPLAALKGYLETWQIKSGSGASEESRSYVETALKNAKQLNGLVDQIFELIHLDSNRVKISKENIIIAELLGDVIQKFTLDIEEKQIKLEATQNSRLVVFADIEKLERVLTNLIDNSISACEPGDSISINLKENKNGIRVSICDTGSGIHQEDIPYIFEPHFRGKNSQDSRKGNSGLGLAITKRLLSLHGIEISVASALGEGTQFSFELGKV